MNKPSFTPGPWHAVSTASVTTVNMAAGYLIAGDVHGANPTQRKANGILIAAAPELYEALRKEREWRDREAVGALDEAWDYETMVGQYRRAALAKAEGKS